MVLACRVGLRSFPPRDTRACESQLSTAHSPLEIVLKLLLLHSRNPWQGPASPHPTRVPSSCLSPGPQAQGSLCSGMFLGRHAFSDSSQPPLCLPFPRPLVTPRGGHPQPPPSRLLPTFLPPRGLPLPRPLVTSSPHLPALRTLGRMLLAATPLRSCGRPRLALASSAWWCVWSAAWLLLH